MKILRNILSLSTVGVMILIFCFSNQASDTSSKVSGKVLSYFINNFDIIKRFYGAHPNMVHTIIRKMAHFSIYMLLGIMVCLMLNAFMIRWAGSKTAFICLFYAISDEFHQYFIPGRSSQVLDVCIDFAGSLTGIVVTTVFLILLKDFISKLTQARKT